MSGLPMELQQGAHGLFFTPPVEVADSIGLAEGDDVTVRATPDGTMEFVRLLGDASREVVATLDVSRRGMDTP